MRLKEMELKKREEICNAIVGKGFSIEEAKKIFEYMEDECLIEIEAPQIEEKPLQNIRIKESHTGRYKGASYKAGNIILNIKESVANAVALGASSIASLGAISLSEPMITFFTILTAVASVAGLKKIELDEDMILILVVLWENRHLYNPIGVEKGLELVNEKLKLHKKQEILETNYNDMLEDLKNIGCITLDNGNICLREKIQISY